MTIVKNHAHIFIAVLITLVVLMNSSAHAEMRIFNLQHKSADELAVIVRQVVSENAKVAAHRNTLVVNSTPSELDEIAKLVDAFDRQQQMLRITVDQGKTSDIEEKRVGAGMRAESGSVRVNAGNPVNPGGSIYVTTGEDSRVRISGAASSRTETRNVSQFINVLEDSVASIAVGRAIPFTRVLRYYYSRHPHFVESTDYQNVDTGFEVHPRVHGKMVELEIRPYMSFLDSRNSNQIVFHELTTKVRLPMGSWYDLGGQLGDRDNLYREILRTGSATGSTSHSIRFRVDSAY